MNRIHALALITCLLAPVIAGATTAEDVIDALGIPAADIVSVTLLEGADEMLWTGEPLGIVNATAPPMGMMYTGRANNITSCQDDDMPPGGDVGDTVAIEVELLPPAGMHSFSFDFYFFTREYPDFVGSVYNDAFTVGQQSAIFNGNIVFDANNNVIDVNTVLFTVVNQADLTGTGFDCGHRGGGTGWLTSISPCDPGQPLILTFIIGDVSDGIYDSSVLLDDFTWDNAIVKAPNPAEPTDDDHDGFGPDDDCDDDDPSINPLADEVCDNGLDDDCDGAVDGEDDDCGEGDDDTAADDDDADDDDTAADDDTDDDDTDPTAAADDDDEAPGCSCESRGRGQTAPGISFAVAALLLLRRRVGRR